MNTKKIALFSGIMLIVGVLFFFFYNSWIMVSWGFPRFKDSDKTLTVSRSEKKMVHLWYWRDGIFKNEKKELLWSNSLTANAACLIRCWLNVLDEEEVAKMACSLQDVSFSSSNQELFISFDQSPLMCEDSVYAQYMFIKSLLKTIAAAGFSLLKRVRFLVQHQPLESVHFDFSFPWPLDGFFDGRTVVQDDVFVPIARKSDAPFTIMLDPMGDARTTGRIIDDVLERGLTLEFAERLKEIMQGCLPEARIFLTRLPGETLEDLQKASFANRLNVDLYVTINFYREVCQKPSIYSYYFTGESVNESAPRYPHSLPLLLSPVDKAHLKNMLRSFSLVYNFQKTLTGSLPVYAIKDPLGIPFKPLAGVIAPAFAVEIGFKSKNDWELLLQNIAHALCTLIQNNK